MEKKKIPSKRRILIALIFGGIFLIGGFIVSFNNPYGNTTEEIQQVEDAIGKKFGSPFEQFKIVALAKPDDFERFWTEINKTIQLAYENERIAKAKALLYFENNPIPSYSFDNNLWTERFDISKQDWKIQSFSSRILKSVSKGFGLLFVSTIITYLILTIVTCLWYFLLNRISELSQAIRGR